MQVLHEWRSPSGACDFQTTWSTWQLFADEFLRNSNINFAVSHLAPKFPNPVSVMDFYLSKDCLSGHLLQTNIS